MRNEKITRDKKHLFQYLDKVLNLCELFHVCNCGFSCSLVCVHSLTHIGARAHMYSVCL